MHESQQGVRSRRWLPWAALAGALVVGGVAGGAIVAATGKPNPRRSRAGTG